MANLSLVVNSKFQPFSFERYIQPYQIYGQAYEKRQEAYDKLAEDSSKWGEQLDPSSQAYDMWKSFQDELNQATTSLQREGLTAKNRPMFSNVRKNYSKNIGAIAEADKRMQAQLALRQQMQAKDNSIEYKNNLNIDDFLHGKSGNNESLSGATMRAETADMASKLGQSIYSNPSFSKVMGGSYWQIAQANGYSPDVLGYIRSGEWANLPHGKNASDADNKLYNDIKQVADLYTSQINRTKGYSQDAQARLGEQIFQGLYSGLEKPKYDFQRNMDYMSAAERDASARGWRGLELEKASQDERAREFNLTLSTKLKEKSESETQRVDRIKTPIAVATYYTGDEERTKKVAGQYYQIPIEDGTYNINKVFESTPILKTYEQLDKEEKEQADKQIKGDNKDAYRYYVGRLEGHVHGVVVEPKAPVNTGKEKINEDAY